MNYSYKKYVVLAILGSLIIGIAAYLFLNSYLEKTGIIVLKEDISEGQIVKESSITTGYYLKNSLPEGYIKNKEEAVGNEGDLLKKLSQDESLISINIDLKEKITEELKVNYMIMLVSTEKNKELEDLFYKNNLNYAELPANGGNSISGSNVNTVNSETSSGKEEIKITKNYLETSTFEISNNVSLIDGYLIIKNIEVLQIKNFQDKNNSLISNSGSNLTTLYLKCNISEAPYIATLSASGKYKIIIGNNPR